MVAIKLLCKLELVALRCACHALLFHHSHSTGQGGDAGDGGAARQLCRPGSLLTVDCFASVLNVQAKEEMRAKEALLKNFFANVNVVLRTQKVAATSQRWEVST